MPPGNLLLERLPIGALHRLQPYIEEVYLSRNEVLHSPGEEIDYLYFPVDSLISVTHTGGDGRMVETAAVGSREVAGINAFMGGYETTDTAYIVQLPGSSLRIAARPFRKEFDTDREIRAVFLKYTQAFIAQISQNMACNRLHDLNERCARWLLEVSDRIQTVQFELKQEFIAQMLGVTRSSVSRAASKLKRARIIDYWSAHIEILDLMELEESSCDCYFLLRKEFERLLGRGSP